MFSMKSTWKEIKTTKPVDTALGDLFPTCWSILLQGHEEETMEQIHDRVHMEWGEAFWSQPLVNCANMLMETAEKQKFLFVPLWHTQKEGWIPKEDQNDEEGVWLFTGNPDVDQQAFMHFDDCASVPPYPSAAVCKERRQEKKRPAVIFCPGGGYEMLSYYSEGVQLAQRMERDGGYKAFILSYRIHQIPIRSARWIWHWPLCMYVHMHGSMALMKTVFLWWELLPVGICAQARQCCMKN